MIQWQWSPSPPPNTTTLYQGSYCMYNMTIRWMFTMNPKGTIWELQSLNAIYSIRVSSCPALNGLSVCRGGEKVQKKCRKSAVKSAVNSLRRCFAPLVTVNEWRLISLSSHCRYALRKGTILDVTRERLPHMFGILLC